MLLLLLERLLLLLMIWLHLNCLVLWLHKMVQLLMEDLLWLLGDSDIISVGFPFSEVLSQSMKRMIVMGFFAIIGSLNWGLDSFVPLFGVRQYAVHEVARTATSLHIIVRTLLQRRFQVIYSEADSSEKLHRLLIHLRIRLVFTFIDRFKNGVFSCITLTRGTRDIINPTPYHERFRLDVTQLTSLQLLS